MAVYGRRHHRPAERETCAAERILAEFSAEDSAERSLDRIVKTINVINIVINCFLLGVVVAQLVLKLKKEYGSV
jgi:hypothetical protein